LEKQRNSIPSVGSGISVWMAMLTLQETPWSATIRTEFRS